jgi:hypothetical protein
MSFETCNNFIKHKIGINTVELNSEYFAVYNVERIGGDYFETVSKRFFMGRSNCC